MDNRGQIWKCADVTCGTSPEARDVDQAREAHDRFEDHPFQPVSHDSDVTQLSADEWDAHPVLFRVVTDGCGRLLAVDDDRNVLGVVELRGDRDVQTELEDHRQALHELVDRIVSDLVDPMD